MQKLYNLLLGENSVILLYNKNFMTYMYLVILNDFDNLKQDKIKFLFSHYGCSVKIWLHIYNEVKPWQDIRGLVLLNMHCDHLIYSTNLFSVNANGMPFQNDLRNKLL